MEKDNYHPPKKSNKQKKGHGYFEQLVEMKLKLYIPLSAGKRKEGLCILVIPNDS